MMNGMEYTGMDAILAGSFRAAIYCRLSKDDDLDGESASIANQRDMLENYCEKQGWEVVAVYQDDGYTGLNMERPDLKRMLKAIERSRFPAYPAGLRCWRSPRQGHRPWKACNR